MREIEIFTPSDFEPFNHFYTRVLNSQVHPILGHFLNMSPARILTRYHHLNPQVDSETLEMLLNYKTRQFFWGGADLLNVTTETGRKKMVVLETNSCPSGQKSMPPRDDMDDYRGYKSVLENTFLPLLKKKRLPKGALAVIYDKNYMESSGYAAALADLSGEPVYLIPFFNEKEEGPAYFEKGILYFKLEGQDLPVRAAFRYVTQKPWNRIPIHTKTFIFNSTLVCLSGGRNKLLASKAYEFFNSEISESGLRINTPETIRDVSKLEIPLWVENFGGFAVIKDPYSNAGQGVYTITCKQELENFMNESHSYDQFIVQSLIGNYQWSSLSEHGKYFHLGTMPNKKGQIFAHDIRVMVHLTKEGLRPCAIYARRARKELPDTIETENSWDILGTNLSVKVGENEWESDTNRLILMDRKEFNSLGIGTDDLIEAYIQTILSMIAIDKMAEKLLNSKGDFRLNLFKSLDNDQSLLREIVVK